MKSEFDKDVGASPASEGFRSILHAPFAYLAYQVLVGGIRARRICIRDYAPVRPGMVVVDIGCGPGYVTKWLPGAAYYGFDISPSYIEYAKRRFGKQGHFRCELFSEKTASQIPKADMVLLMGVLHHLDDREALALLSLIRSALRPDGCLLTLDGCYRPGQSRIERYFLDSDRGKHIRESSEYGRMAQKVFGEVVSTVREDLFFIPQSTVILTCHP